MKRADIILGITVLLVCFVWLGQRYLLRRTGASVVVELDGRRYGSYDLGEDQEIDIGEGNHISIRDGAVQMSRADCSDQICVRQGKVSAQGDTIICLPNRVVVRVSGGGQPDGADVDMVVS